MDPHLLGPRGCCAGRGHSLATSALLERPSFTADTGRSRVLIYIGLLGPELEREQHLIKTQGRDWRETEESPQAGVLNLGLGKHKAGWHHGAGDWLQTWLWA